MLKRRTGILCLGSITLLYSQTPAPQTPAPPPGQRSDQIGRPDSSGEVIDGGGATLSTTTAADFIKGVAKENDRQIREARSALTRASERELKTFAQMLIDDKQKLSRDLSGLATKKGVRLPTSTSSANDFERSFVKGFDQSFLERQITYHRQQIQSFEEVAKSHSDSEVRAFAATRLGSLRKHEQEARRIFTSLKGDSR
jgi:putative membrane protein